MDSKIIKYKSFSPSLDRYVEKNFTGTLFENIKTELLDALKPRQVFVDEVRKKNENTKAIEVTDFQELMNYYWKKPSNIIITGGAVGVRNELLNNLINNALFEKQMPVFLIHNGSLPFKTGVTIVGNKTDNQRPKHHYQGSYEPLSGHRHQDIASILNRLGQNVFKHSNNIGLWSVVTELIDMKNKCVTIEALVAFPFHNIIKYLNELQSGTNDEKITEYRHRYNGFNSQIPEVKEVVNELESLYRYEYKLAQHNNDKKLTIEDIIRKIPEMPHEHQVQASIYVASRIAEVLDIKSVNKVEKIINEPITSKTESAKIKLSIKEATLLYVHYLPYADKKHQEQVINQILPVIPLINGLKASTLNVKMNPIFDNLRAHPLTLKDCIEKKGFFCFDLSEHSSKFYQELIFTDIGMLKRQGHPFLIVIDNITLPDVENSAYKDIISEKSEKYPVILSSNDLLSALHGDEKLFKVVTGGVQSDVLVLKQSPSAACCWSEFFSDYDHTAISKSQSGIKILKKAPVLDNQQISESEARRPNIMPEQFRKLHPYLAVAYTSVDSQIYTVLLNVSQSSELPLAELLLPTPLVRESDILQALQQSKMNEP